MKTVYLAPVVGGVALGIGYGNIGAIVSDGSFLQYYSSPSAATQQALAGAMQAGCIVGSMLGGLGADHIGRRGCCISSAFVLVLGCTVTLAPLVMQCSLAPIFVGRVLIGMGGGAACCSVPMYISESSTADQRGAVEASFQLAVEVGILAAYILNYLVLTRLANGWCLSLAVQLPPCLAFLLVMVFLPESPRWLLYHRDSASDARKALVRLRKGLWDEAVTEELLSMQASTSPSGDVGSRCWDICNKQCLVAAMLLVLQVGTGIDVITVYAPGIFSKVLGGDSEIDSLLYTIYVGITFCVATPLAVFTVDRCGRRPLLIVGALGMTSMLTVLALGSHLGGTWKVVAVLAFVAFFSFSWGPLAWVIPSEMVPTRVRAKVLTLGTIFNWVADYLVVSTYLSLSNALGEDGAFGVYAIINLGALIFILCLVPETKGIELDTDTDERNGQPSDATSLQCRQ